MRSSATCVLLLACLAGAPRPALAQSDSDAYLDFLMARHLEAEGKEAEALAALKRAAERDPKSAEIRSELAAFHMRQNDIDAAEKAAREALTLDSANIEAHRVLGLILAAYAESADEKKVSERTMEFVRDAVGHLEKVAGTPGGATDLNVQYNLGRLHLRSGDTNKAIERLQAVVDQNPYSIQARLSLAQAFSEAERHEEAAETLAPAVEDDPRLASTLAQFYERAGKREEATAAYHKALEANPKDLRALLALSRAYSLEGEHEKAIETLARAQAIVPEDAGITAFLVQTYLQAKRYTEAAMLSAEAQKKHKGDLRFTRLHARALFETGDRSRAIALMESAMRAAPEDTASHLALADLYVDAGREAEAVKMLDAAAEKFPKDADVLNFLGYLLADRGERLDDAVRLVTRALHIDPDNPSYLDSLGWAHFKRGELADAHTHIARAAEALPSNSVIQDHYGDVLVRMGKPAEAVAAWQRALDGDGEDIDKAAVEKKIRNAKAKK
jgi:tetratricopeptide (TPR) repeat protein